MIISFHYIPNFPSYVFFYKHKHRVFNTKDIQLIQPPFTRLCAPRYIKPVTPVSPQSQQ